MLLSRQARLRAVASRLGSIFFQGLIAVLPISATLAVFLWATSKFENFFSPPIQWIIGEKYYTPPMGLVTGFVLIFLVGLVVNHWFTQQLLAWGERMLHGLPLAKTILSGVKDLMGFFHRDNSSAANQVVVVELNGLRLMGLVTRQTLDDLPAEIREGDRVAVYFPMSYQLGGFTCFVPRKSIMPIDLPMEQAMRFILTAGVKTEKKSENADADSDGAATTPSSPVPPPVPVTVARRAEIPGSIDIEPAPDAAAPTAPPVTATDAPTQATPPAPTPAVEPIPLALDEKAPTDAKPDKPA